MELLGKYGEDAKLLAGGQSLIPLMKLRIVSPAHLIDLGRVSGLEYVKAAADAVTIGAMTRMADVESSDVLKQNCPIVSECAAQVADPLVRNLGTIGGNVSHADPTNDMPAVMVATGARLPALGMAGTRTIEAERFFLDMFTTALRHDEVLTEMRIPTGARRGGAYVKLERQAGDFGIVGAAAVLELDGSGRCATCSLALTGVGPTVVRAAKAGASVVGSKVDKDAIEKAGKLASGETSPTGDLRGSERYKREMAAVATGRALAQALKRARAGT